MTSGSSRTITDTSTASSSAKSMLSRAFHRTLPVSDAFAEARAVSKHKGPELTPNSSLDSTASCSSWGSSSSSPISVSLPKRKKKHSVSQYPAKCINVVVTGVSALSTKWLPWQEDGDSEEYDFRSVDMSALALRRVPARLPDAAAAAAESTLSLRRVFHLRRRRTASALALEPTHMSMGPPLPDSTHLAPTPSRPHHLDTLESPPSHESRAVRFAPPPGMVLPPSGASGSGEKNREDATP